MKTERAILTPRVFMIWDIPRLVEREDMIRQSRRERLVCRVMIVHEIRMHQRFVGGESPLGIEDEGAVQKIE